MVDIRCPKCGRKTTIRTSKKDGSQYFICLKYPKCKGRVPVEEDLSGGWGQESPAPEAARHSPRRRKKPSAQRSGENAVRKSGQAKRGFYAVIKRPGRKGRISIDKGMEENREKPASKSASDSLSRRRVAPVEEKPSGGKEPPEPKGQRKPGHAFYRPLYKRGPGPGPVLPQEQEKPKPAPYRPLFRRLKSWETEPEEQGQSEPQGKTGSQPAPYRPQYRRGVKPAPVAPQGQNEPTPPPYKPLFPRAEKRRLFPREQETAKPRRRKAPKGSTGETSSEKAPDQVQEGSQQPNT